MKTCWSGKMLPSSPKMSLKCHNSSSRKHGGPAIGNTWLGPEVVDVADGAVHLPVALLLAERRLRRGRQLVDHRVPDGAGELQHVRVYVTEFVERHQIGRAGVVLVEHADAAVLDP